MDRLHKIIEERREALGLSKAELGKLALGSTGEALLQNIRRGSAPSFEKLSALCRVLDLEFYVGPRQPLLADADGNAAAYARIPFYDVDASAGPGASADAHADVQTYAFRRDWFDRIGVAPQNAVMLRTRGDSMAPQIRDGDVLMIDTTKRNPSVTPRSKTGQPRAKIYVVDVDGETRVKWIERPDTKQIILFSEDYQNHPPEAFAGKDQDRLRFIGKVIWWGHTVD